MFRAILYTDEDMMMDTVQTATPAQPTEDMTELGKCLIKHEVSPTGKGKVFIL